MTFSNRLALFAANVLCAAALGQVAGDSLKEARSLVDAEDFKKSDEVLRRDLVLHPDSADAHFLLGYVLFREQNAKESLEEFTAGAKYRRPKADELKVVASDYVMLGDYADADKWYSAVTAENPTDADAWYLLGRAKYSETDFPAAISSFQHALLLIPRHVEAENNLGLAWREMNEMDKAKAAFQAAIDWQGDHLTDPQPLLNLGTLLADAKQFDRALPYLIEAAALAPENPRIHDELAHVYEAQSNLAKAQSELERAVALAPSATELHFKLGRIYRREGLQAQAKREFDLCDKLNGTHSSVITPNPPKH